VRWLKEACRILKPDGTIWVTGTPHIIFSLGFALQTMKFKLINVIRAISSVAWELAVKAEPSPFSPYSPRRVKMGSEIATAPSKCSNVGFSCSLRNAVRIHDGEYSSSIWTSEKPFYRKVGELTLRLVVEKVGEQLVPEKGVA
jgi:hypothetical protein